jgi:restriction system protein
MARRKKGIEGSLIVAALVLGAIGWFLNHAAQVSQAATPIVVAVGLMVIAIIVARVGRGLVVAALDHVADAKEKRALLRSQQESSRRRIEAWQSLNSKVEAATKQHLTALVRRRAQLVQNDAYGNPRIDSWEKELRYFLTNQVQDSLSGAERFELTNNAELIFASMDETVRAAARDQPVPSFSQEMTPAEFETFCAETLQRAGWDARVTMQSRDQGIDVIAEKMGRRIVLQCKLYARPVGNKAVQEVAAGRAHERADLGAVVTNHRFTLAAEQLAATNGVLLLHYRDLPSIDQLIAAR